MPFACIKGAATIHASIDGSLQPGIDRIGMWYVDDIPINSTTEVEYENLGFNVLGWPQEHQLSDEAQICHFGDSEVAFPIFGNSANGVTLESGYLSTIENWAFVQVHC